MNKLSLTNKHKKLKVGDIARASVGRFKFIKSFEGKLIEESDWIENKVMKTDTRGVNLIVRAIIGDNTYAVEVTHAKIGTGTNVVTEADTDLQTPQNLSGGSDPTILRGDESVVSVNIAHLEFFISNAQLPNGTYTEWGLFTGTFGVNEKLFARALITPTYSKGTNQDTTVVHEITINN